MKRSVTIQDVATKSSVSKATVSLVLNGRPGFKPETVERVQAAARELGFTPNGAARRLGSSGAMGAKTMMIGFLCDHHLAPGGPDNYHFNVMLGAQSAAHAASYHVVVNMNLPTPNEQLDYIRGLTNGGVDGWILADSVSADVIAFLADRQIPKVIAGDTVFFPETTSIHGDSVGGATLATQHLLDLGHKRIAFVGWQPQIAWCAMRLAGYLGALAAAGRPRDEGLVLYADKLGKFDGWLSQTMGSDNPPTAIFAGTDWLAVDIIKSANRLGISIPGDLSIVGFDDAPWLAPVAVPALTSVRVSIGLIGEMAFRYLHSEIQGLGSPGSHVALPVELIERDSTAAPAPRRNKIA